MKYNRGGKTIAVGDIGRFKTLRQLILYPGERMRQPRISGNVRVSGLKQQTSVYLHAQIEAFAAPLRWFQTDFPDYLQEGNGTAKTIDTLTGAWTTAHEKTTNMGIGKITNDIAKFFAQMPISVWNEWYRWAEDSKFSVTTPDIDFFKDQGQPVNNLASAPTRLHDIPSFDSTETNVIQLGGPPTTHFDVRDLEQIQARFAMAAKTDWTSQERYQAFMKDVYGASGSREVDKVPTRLRSGATLSVKPKDFYASDGSSLGEIMSINNFTVGHSWGDYVAKEHEIVIFVMVLRFAPVFSAGVHPMAYPADHAYSLWNGDPVAMAGERPVAVKAREIEDGDATVLGYLPANWQAREGYNHVDQTVKNLGNFPLLDTAILTAAAHRDASNIEPAFRSLALRHWFCDMDFDLTIESRIPSAGESIMVGAGTKGSKPGGNHPTGGFLK